MTEAAAEASELASVSGARTGDALAGGIACLGGFAQRCVKERRTGSARSRSVRSGVELSCTKADESGAPGSRGKGPAFHGATHGLASGAIATAE